MLSQDWDIKPRALACAQCQQNFIDQQAYVSRLILEPDGYLRQDYCKDCWGKDHQNDKKTLSMWRATFQAPPPPASEPLKKETAESLLRGLMEQNDPANKNAIFVLAVALERKRLLLERDTHKRSDGTVSRVYEHRQTGETFVILDPGFSLDQLGEVQKELLTRLDPQPPRTAPLPPASGND